MAVHFHAPPPKAAPPPAQPSTALPEHDIIVNGTPITPREVAAEMQHHPAPSPEAAWTEAARALVVRRLLLDAARDAALADEDEDATIDALLRAEVTIPEPDDAAARRWHAAHPERFGTPESWDASHILLAADPEDDAERTAARKQAEALLAEILATPGALPDLAHRHSACPSREQGGHLGRIERGSTVPEFETMLAGLEPGQVCPLVVPTRYGMHVIHLHRHTPRRDTAFDDARRAVLDDLRRAAWQAAVRQYIAVLAARATIEGFILGAEGEARADGPLVN
ncbi:peptidylprolyl isomerase [Roseomonas sp. CECT 9278]|uniref:peptidylprolyl isomerase n=1 Tax=Roseomonas sp. CECT 9278 TaxID=2845823 RepID=UPI001E50E219|nr:peptidylprolyl isomerase [Roseomonas sp. CECT 9278]